MNEEWRRHPIIDRYEISNLGRVRRAAPGPNTRVGKILKQTWSGPHGYLIVHPSGFSNRQVHTLVLECFVGVRPPNLEARHLDGDRTNNRADNLVWGTPLENGQDRERHGRTARGSRGGRAKLTEADVRAIRSRHRPRIVTFEHLASEFGVSVACIQAIIQCRNWKHLGPQEEWPHPAPIEHRPSTRANQIERQYAHIPPKV